MSIKDTTTFLVGPALAATAKPQTEPATARGTAFPFLNLPSELVFRCIDGYEEDAQAMLALSCVNKATRSLVANTDLYRSYVAQKSQALLEHAFHLEAPLSEHSLLRDAKALEIFQVPDAFETPAHLHAILSAADAIESLTVHPRWFRAPFFDVLSHAAECHDGLKTLRVQRGMAANIVPHQSERDWEDDTLSSYEQQRLTRFLNIFARKEKSTLLLNIDITGENLSKIFLQALPQPNKIAKLSFYMPVFTAPDDVFAVIQKLVASPALNCLEIDGRWNVDRSDLSEPKLISMLDAIAGTQSNLQLLDLSGWHDVHNNHLRLLDARLDKLAHLGAVKCPVALNRATRVPPLGLGMWSLNLHGSETPAHHGYFGLNERLKSSTAPKILNASAERFSTFYLNTPASFFGPDETEAANMEWQLERDPNSETIGLF